jgi:nitrous oxidase accessory protein NosD
LRSNIVLDGAGYTLRGSFNGNKTDIWVVGTGPDPTMAYYTIGVDLGSKSVDGVTVKNLNVENFSIGMYIWTENNTLVGNSFSRCIVGLLMSGSNSTVTRNYISNNIEGLFFGFNTPTGQFPPNMVVYENAFLKNNIQISGCQCKAYNLSETPHEWDKGKTGNYWSDYNGTGSTPYVIDVLDKDNFPLMQIPVEPPVHAPKITVNIDVIVLVVSFPVALAAGVFAFNRRRGLKK